MSRKPPALSAPGYITQGSVNLTWSPAGGANRYELQRAQAGNWSTIFDGEAQAFTSSGLVTGTYQFRVRGCRVVCGEWSNTASVAVELPPAAVPVLSVPTTAFNGSYSLGGPWIQFKGWAQTTLKLYFDASQQTGFGTVAVDGVSLEGVKPIANTVVTVFVQSAINQRVNPLVLVSEKQLSLAIPVKASIGSVKARAKDVRAEILEGGLKLHLTYEFRGVRGEGT